LAQTKIVKESANPKWNETKYVIVTSFNDVLTLQVFDYNEYRKDKELGAASFPLERVHELTEYENEQLEVMTNEKLAASSLLILGFSRFSKEEIFPMARRSRLLNRILVSPDSLLSKQKT